MKELEEKYARVLLETCLKVEENQPLFISFNIERIDFVRTVAKIAFEMGVKDIFFEGIDPYLKRDALLNLEIDELKELTFWNKEMWNVYAKKNAAFLMLASENPGLMKDVDSKKMAAMTKYSLETRKEFDDMRDKSMLAWCIAAVPTDDWAQTICPDAENPTEELWNKIFDICSIKEDDPVKIWEDIIKKLDTRAQKLNKYQFQTLKYQSSNGTDFRIDLPKNHLWASGKTVLANGKEVLVNFPTEEVFTSPDCYTAEGIVFATKPLSYQDVIIDYFSVEFEGGKVKSATAKYGEDTLKEMIGICENSDRLGEVALVPYDSPISNTKQLFLETLFDENAACHIALGDSFPECVENGPSMDKNTLLDEYHLNKCDSHVDFMIGSSDMNITGITKDGEEVPIFINGNFSEEFN